MAEDVEHDDQHYPTMRVYGPVAVCAAEAISKMTKEPTARAVVTRLHSPDGETFAVIAIILQGWTSEEMVVDLVNAIDELKGEEA